MSEEYDADAELERLLDDGDDIPSPSKQGFNNPTTMKLKEGSIGFIICVVLTAYRFIMPFFLDNAFTMSGWMCLVVRAIIFFDFFKRYYKASLSNRWGSVKTFLIYLLYDIVDCVLEAIIMLIFSKIALSILGRVGR